MASKKTSLGQEFTKGLLKENPILRLVLGTCPTLAVTTSVENGIGMGLAATFVLVCSNLVISLLRNIIPEKVRIPAFITVIAGFVTILEMLMKAYFQELNAALGIYIPLITVNCIILARAEMFASKNSVLPSILDGLGMGIGYTAALIVMSSIREILGNGTFLNIAIPFLKSEGGLEPMLFFILPPGGFFVFGMLIALSQKLAAKLDAKAGVDTVGFAGCAGSIEGSAACAACGGCGMVQQSGRNYEVHASGGSGSISSKEEMKS